MSLTVTMMLVIVLKCLEGSTGMKTSTDQILMGVVSADMKSGITIPSSPKGDDTVNLPIFRILRLCVQFMIDL